MDYSNLELLKDEQIKFKLTSRPFIFNYVLKSIFYFFVFFLFLILIDGYIFHIFYKFDLEPIIIMIGTFLPIIILSYLIGKTERDVKSTYFFTEYKVFRVGKWKIAWLLNKRIISFRYDEISFCKVKPHKEIIIYKKSPNLELSYDRDEEELLIELEDTLDNHYILFNAKNEKEKFNETLQFLMEKVPLAQHSILSNLYYSK